MQLLTRYKEVGYALIMLVLNTIITSENNVESF